MRRMHLAWLLHLRQLAAQVCANTISCGRSLQQAVRCAGATIRCLCLTCCPIADPNLPLPLWNNVNFVTLQVDIKDTALTAPRRMLRATQPLANPLTAPPQQPATTADTPSPAFSEAAPPAMLSLAVYSPSAASPPMPQSPPAAGTPAPASGPAPEKDTQQKLVASVAQWIFVGVCVLVIGMPLVLLVISAILTVISGIIKAIASRINDCRLARLKAR